MTIADVKGTIKSLDEAFKYIPEKERGYILGYAQAVADQKAEKERGYILGYAQAVADQKAEKERGYILGYAQAVADQKEKQKEKEMP